MAGKTDSTQAEKFRIAREFIKVSQQEVASANNTTQTVISSLETQDKKQVSISYLSYLFKKGVDLNLLFDPNIAPEEFSNYLKNPENIRFQDSQKIQTLEDLVFYLQDKIRNIKKK